MRTAEESPNTQVLLSLLGEHYRNSSEIRQDMQRVTYATIGFYVVVMGWTLNLSRDLTAWRHGLSASLLGVAGGAIYYLYRRQRAWLLHHEVLQRIDRALGCHTPGHFIDGEVLYPCEWDRCHPSASRSIWALAGAILAFCVLGILTVSFHHCLTRPIAPAG